MVSGNYHPHFIFIFKDIGSDMDPNAFNRIEVFKTFYIYIQCLLFMWLFKRLLKKMNGRKQKQTGCLENIVWIEGYVTIFWILNVISNIIYHYWITVNAQCHIQSKGHSLHQFSFCPPLWIPSFKPWYLPLFSDF